MRGLADPDRCNAAARRAYPRDMSSDRSGSSDDSQRDSRVLVFSQRRLDRPLWHATQLEMEDVLADVDDVDLLSPPPAQWPDASRMVRRVGQAVQLRAGVSRRTPPYTVSAISKTAVEADHDVFFAVFHHSHELAHLARLPGWRKRCRTAVCVLIEQWSTLLEADADYLDQLRQFDHVYLFNPTTADRLAARGIPRPRFLATAVDALRFAPPRPSPPRVIDCYSYGRTSPVTHRALRRMVESEGLTYLYDTTTGGRLVDAADHRSLMASIMQRSRFFLAWTINDSPERLARTGGDQALSTRYFEGTAGGAVLLGSRPDAPEFDECFDWPDVVLPLPYDSADIPDVLRDLSADEERLATIRAANVRNSLRRHDWAHRWARILADIGLTPTDGLVQRLGRLDERADVVGQDWHGGSLD
jgi:hypothetical protein